MKIIVSQKGLKVLSTLTKPIAFNVSRLVAFAKPTNCELFVKIKFSRKIEVKLKKNQL